MKVSALIYELSKYNPDADVSLVTCNDICISHISEDGATPRTTKQIFIEEENSCDSCVFHDGGGYCETYNKKIEDVEECNQYLEE